MNQIQRRDKHSCFWGISHTQMTPIHDNARWNTWGIFIERNAAYQPWIWTAGNHELDFAPELV